MNGRDRAHLRWIMWGSAALAWMLGLPGAYCCAQEPIIYRREYVPATELAGHIRDLLPLKREEFERLTRNAEPETLPHGPPFARIEELAWHARLEGLWLVDGTLDLTITTAGRAFLPLDLGPLVVESATWPEEGNRAALIGADSRGNILCLADKGGKLRIGFRTAGVQESPGVVTFNLRLPGAPRQSLEVEGTGRGTFAAEQGVFENSAQGDDAPPRQRWTAQLGGRQAIQLQYRSALEQPRPRSQLVVRESTTYSVNRGTLDLEATFALDSLGETIDDLQFQAPGALRLTAVRIKTTTGDRAAPFALAGTGGNDTSTCAIRLPPEAAKSKAEIVVAATADWTGDQQLSLPRVQVLGGLYQEGRVTVLSPAWLRLEPERIHGCQQTSALGSGANRTLDRFEFRVHAADASVEFRSNQSVPPLRESSGTQLQVDSLQVNGVWIAEVAPLWGERHALEAVVPRPWILDAVETQPAELLADRQVLSSGAGQQLLRINLARPINPERPLKLILRAHCQRPPSRQALTSDLFTLGSLADVQEQRRMIAIRSLDPATQLRITDAPDLHELSVDKLSPAELRLFESTAGTVLFEADSAADGLQVKLDPALSHYRADVKLQCVLEENVHSQSAVVRCQPDNSNVASLLVRISPAPAGTVSWRLKGEESSDLQVSLSPPPKESATAEEALYRVTLARPRSAPFELLAEWSGKKTAAEIPLVWLPEAASLAGVVEIHALGGQALALEAEAVQPLPLPTPTFDRPATLRARYGYQSGRQARIFANIKSPAPLPALWATQMRLQSTVTANGPAEHEATFDVMNPAQAELRLRLPITAFNLRLVEDESSSDRKLSLSAAGEIAIPPPLRAGPSTVRLRFSSAAWNWGWLPARRFDIPVPLPQVPVLSRHWNIQLPPGLSCWGPVSNLPGHSGWKTINKDLPGAPHATLTVFDATTLQVWSLCLAACSFVLARRFRVVSALAIPPAGVLLGAAIVATQPWSPLLAGMSLGLFGGTLWSMFRPRELDSKSSAPAGHGSPGRSTAATRLGAVAGLCWLAWGLATPSWTIGADGTSARPSLVIPVNDRQEPTGDYVYADPRLYEALLAAAATSDHTTPDYLLDHARYEVPDLTTAGDSLHVEGLVAEFDLHTFRDQTNVALALRREQALLHGGSLLDGQPARLAWDDNGQHLAFHVPSAGKHRLRLTLSTVAKRQGTEFLMDLSIPAAARAEVRLPTGAQLEAAGATAGEARSAGSESQVVPIGASRQLLIRGPLAARPQVGAGPLEGRQLLLWKIRPGSVSLEGRFELNSAGRLLREAVIAFDPRLIPVFTNEGGLTLRVEEGRPQLLHVEFAQPTDTAKFHLSWLWADASGAGTLALPNVSLQVARVTRAWTAIQTDHALDCSECSPAKESKRFVSAADFNEAWGDHAAVADLAFAADFASSLTVLDVRPKPQQPRATQSIDWSLAESTGLATVRVRLSQVPQDRFVHRVRMPAEVQVWQAELWQAGERAAARWSQQADGLLQITAASTPAEDQELHLRAKWSVPRTGETTALPPIEILDADRAATELMIYRQPDALVTLRSAAGWQDANSAAVGQFREQFGRLLAVLTCGAASVAPPQFAIRPNSSTASGNMFLHVGEENGEWQAEILLDLQVERSLLDQVLLEIPADWAGPFAVEPATAALELSRGESGQRLRIRPPQAAAGPLQLSIRGPLNVAGGRPRAPEVRLVGPAVVRRFLVLDTGSQDQRIEWQTRGLRPVSETPPSLPPQWQGPGHELLEVVGPRLEAVAQIERPQAQTPAVPLADVQFELAAPSRFLATANFLILPAGAAHAAFALPANCRLIQALVDGALADCRPTGVRQWQLAAPSDSLPYLLSIVYEGRMTPARIGGEHSALPAPQIQGLTTRQTLWTVRSPANQPAAVVASDALPLASSAELELARLEAAVVALADAAAAPAGDLPADVLLESVRRWQQAAHAARQRLAEEADRANSADRLAEKLQSVLVQLAEVEQDLPGPRTNGAADAQLLPHADFAPSTTGQAWYGMTGPATAALPVRWRRPTAALFDQPATRALIAVAGSVLIWLVLRWPVGQVWWLANAHLAMALAGVAWWLVAPLGGAGLVVMLVAAGLAWFSRRSGPGGESPSTIRRLPSIQVPGE